MRNPQPLSRGLQIGSDQQSLSTADHIFGKCVLRPPLSFGQHPPIPHLQLKPDLLSLLKRDIEIAGIENLSQLNLDGAQNFILIQSRADRFPDVRQQLILFRSPVRIVADHVILQREPQLQRQSHHQARPRRAKNPPLPVGKHDHSKIIFPGLQIHCRQIPDSNLQQDALQLRKFPYRTDGQRLCHVLEFVYGKNTAVPVCQVAQVISRSAAFQLFQKAL